MSFQGDLGGLGLADLFQSLARGRAGILSLHSKAGLRATLGLTDGMLHLLPEPDEDPEGWRRIARNAWVDDPETLVDALRMEEIARARRIETLYRLLDSDSVHFRFAPGPIPRRPEGSGLSAAEPGLDRAGPGRESVWTAPLSVEGTLLEYARLKDEAGPAGVWHDLGDAVLQRLDAGPAQGELERLHRQCDGHSSLQEVADRLGWPLRQAQNLAQAELSRGALRFSTCEELLYLVQHELAGSRPERAASRLRIWIAVAPGGPLSEVDARAFEAEWQAGRLLPVIQALRARDARTFLRRLDHSILAPVPSLQRWKDVSRDKPNDRVAQLRLLCWQLRASVDPNVPSVRDLLSLCRALLRENRRLGAAAVARIAASRAPETSSVRLEVGHALVQAGAGAEAAPFLLDVIRPLLDQGQSEQVLPVLRALVQACPDQRDARRLLLRAKAHSVQRTLVRKHSIVTLSVVLALSSGAIVQYRSHRDTEDRLVEVTALMADPAAALRALEAAFAGDDSPRVRALRSELTERLRLEDLAERTAWTDAYNAAAAECTVGDVHLGLRRLLELPELPPTRPGEEPLPLASDLYNGLAARLDALAASIGEAIVEDQEQQRNEQRQIADLRALEEIATGAHGEPGREFRARLQALRERLERRDEVRAAERAARQERENLALQDVLINTARAHTTAGDHTRARAAYRKLVESDPGGKLAQVFAREISATESRCTAIAEARRLAENGEHAQARQVLSAALEDPDAWLLPWKVVTVPAGARARLPDGTERVTPFVYESAWDETLEIAFEREDHEPITLSIEHPADQLVTLSRVPERMWPARGRVEAPPVAVGDDHIVCDRGGEIARIARGGRVVWQKRLGSLGGFGRAPVFLARRPGHLLAVTEDGEVWIVDAQTGESEGPWSCGSLPVEGPELAQDGVAVRFQNGDAYQWTSRLKPEAAPADAAAPAQDPAPGPDFGSDAGLSILRRRASAATELESRWSPYRIEVEDELLELRASGSDDLRASVRRAGEWVFVAWEAPNGSIPHGRVWISDGRGLRAFVP